MQIAIVSGSQRKESQSQKVSEYLQKEIIKKGFDAKILNLANNPLPLWDEEARQENSDLAKAFQPFSKILQAADAVIVISPEWHGMATAGLKNLFLYCTNRELAHKPALLVSVSAGRGGSYPIAELRMSGYKNNRVCYMPEHLIVRNVNHVLNDEVAQNQDDEYLRKRIDYNLISLFAYAKAFQPIREKLLPYLDEYPNGM